MKTKISILIFACFAFILPTEAQKYLNVYQDNVVIKRIPSSEIDSISVSSSEPHIVEMWYNGSIFQTYYAEEIDSIKVTRDDEPISFIGIVGFNDELYKKETGVLATSTAGQYKSFVKSLPQKDGTLLYFAVDNALDMLEAYRFNTPIKSVNFITFTDGLDLGSTMMNETYWTTNEYLNAMSSRIRGTQIEGLSINAYTVGLRGRDVTDVEMFKRNLVSLASNEDYSFEVHSFYEIHERLQDIANRIISITNRQTVSVKVPGIDNGSRMRFIFDGQTVEDSQFYIEGTLNMADHSLHDVTYHGMRARSGSVVQGTQDGIFLTFTFRGLQRLDCNGLIPMTNIKHYYLLPSSGSWQINSEFRPDNNTQRTVTYTGTSIFLVLDCSSSLGSDIDQMKNYAYEFIDMVAGNALPVIMEKPKNVTAEIIELKDHLAVQLNWDRVRFAESYDIYRSDEKSSGFTLIASDITALSYADMTPLDGNNYYQIEAKGHGLTSNRSANADIYVTLEKPENVTAEIIELKDHLAVQLNWDRVRFAESYDIYRSDEKSSGFTLIASDITALSYADMTPLDGNNYYQIEAKGHGLTSNRSANADIYVTLEKPENVTAEISERNDHLAVQLNWDRVRYAESYNIYRSNTSSSGFTLIASDITALNYTDSSPLDGSNYYQIEAKGQGLRSSRSANAFIYVNKVKVSVELTGFDENSISLKGSVQFNDSSYGSYLSAGYCYYNGSQEVRLNSKVTSDGIIEPGTITRLDPATRYAVAAYYEPMTSSHKFYSEFIDVVTRGVLFSPAQESLEVDCDGGTFEIPIKMGYETKWEVSTAPSWCTCSPQEGKLIVKVQKTEAPDDRSDAIILTARGYYGDTTSSRILVYQKGKNEGGGDDVGSWADTRWQMSGTLTVDEVYNDSFVADFTGGKASFSQGILGEVFAHSRYTAEQSGQDLIVRIFCAIYDNHGGVYTLNIQYTFHRNGSTVTCSVSGSDSDGFAISGQYSGTRIQ